MRGRGITPEEVEKLFTRLGFGPGDLQPVLSAPTEAEAAARLDDLKGRLRRQFRQVAMELHPDRTGGDEAKTEEFKALSGLLDQFLDVQALGAPPVRRQPVRVVVRQQHWGDSTTAATDVAFTFVINGVPFRF